MKYLILPIFAFFITIFAGGCGPYPQEYIEEIKNNETAFVIPLEGDTKKQAQLLSEEFLKAAQVATKRIVIPQRKYVTGRLAGAYEWIPTARVIKVDRSPVTSVWVGKEAVPVESLDSVGFSVGINCTGMIREEDAAKFLYYYPGNTLGAVMGTNVRGFIQNILSREFGGRNLAQCLTDKNAVIAALVVELKNHFSQYGITISSVGIADGLTYENPSVQKTIDEVFVNATRIKLAEQEKLAQAVLNERDLSIAKNERAKAEEFAKAAQAQEVMTELKIKTLQAEAALVAAQRWDGKLPANVVPANSPMLFQFGNKQ